MLASWRRSSDPGAPKENYLSFTDDPVEQEENKPHRHWVCQRCHSLPQGPWKCQQFACWTRTLAPQDYPWEWGNQHNLLNEDFEAGQILLTHLHEQHALVSTDQSFQPWVQILLRQRVHIFVRFTFTYISWQKCLPHTMHDLTLGAAGRAAGGAAAAWLRIFLVSSTAFTPSTLGNIDYPPWVTLIIKQKWAVQLHSHRPP